MVPTGSKVEEVYRLLILDVFGKSLAIKPCQFNQIHLLGTSSQEAYILEGDINIPAALVRQGLIPCAPYHPSMAVTTRVLELYRNNHLHCPHLAIQPFVKSLCDLHGKAFRPYLSQQFSICYDLYIQIRDEANLRVALALSRDAPQWRLQNACPACTYKLEGESKLIFDMLCTMDGNDSLKRIIRREPAPLTDGDEAPQVGASRESPDSREVGGDYYLTREKVDRWAKAALEQLLQVDDDGEGTPCEARWQNMINEVAARMWGIFDETGVFLALCRHGFVLIIADMVRSGELYVFLFDILWSEALMHFSRAKYPLAIVEALLDAFGSNIGGGYDIGCKFGITLARSELGPRAQELHYQALVGSFHGHAHNRLCQLTNLATYVPGMGVEDLEGCERFFSKSNALASSLRYASIFHRQQKIVEYIKHNDSFEVFQNLSKRHIALSTHSLANVAQASSLLTTTSSLSTF